MSSDAEFVCPLCTHACRSHNHLRQHLHDHHHKSEIIDSYLECILSSEAREE